MKITKGVIYSGEKKYGDASIKNWLTSMGIPIASRSELANT